MTDYDFLSHEKLGERLYAVRECFSDEEHFNIYVVVGENKVGVFDSGMGVTGALRRYIEENITDKRPMVNYATHGDLDHIGGAILFDQYYLNSKDRVNLAWDLNVERRFSDLGVFCANNQEVLDYCRDRYVHNENIQFRDVEDGDVIDLGGVVFTAFSLPGHSKGSMAYINKEEKYVIMGDGVSRFCAWQRCDDFNECLARYEKLISIVPADYTLYNGHDTKAIGYDVLLDMIQGFKEVLAGQTENDEKFAMWKFPMVNPIELEYDMHLHHTGSVTFIYNAKVL